MQNYNNLASVENLLLGTLSTSRLIIELNSSSFEFMGLNLNLELNDNFIDDYCVLL